MISKLNAVFRNLSGSERHQSNSGSRKRSSESLDDVSQDILETPQAKRSRTSNHSDDLSHSRATTPLVKAVTWLQQKASTFSETYFFRPVGNLVQNSYPSPPPGTSDINHLHQAQVMSDTPGQQVRRKDVSTNQPVKGAFKQPDGVPHHKQTSNTSHHQVKPPHSHNNGRQVERDGFHRIGGTRAGSKEQSDNKSSTPHTVNTSTAAIGLSKRDSYIPVRDKLFPHPKRRVVISHASRGHPHISTNLQTVNECVRLREKQQYKKLLEQFTIGHGMGSLGPPEPSEATINESKPQPTTSRVRPGAVPEVSAASTRLEATSQRSPKERAGLRVLPHQFSTQHEMREAVRQRLHVPTSQLSPGTPQGEKPVAVTPAQPDFNDTSPATTIIASKPGMTAFQKSLMSTPYLSEDWIHDLKARFESSARISQREIEEEKSKLQCYEDRRAKGQAEAKELINARIKRAVGLPGAVEDVIYRPEEKKPEDSITVIDDEEEEEEEEEDDGVEEEEEEELPELTDEMEYEISRALNPNPASEGLVTGFRLTITRRDMQTLAGLNWLNDEVMNFYFELLMSRSKEEDYPSVHSFNTFFYPKLINSGYASLRRWTKKVDIFTKDLILVPVHLGMHWCLAVIDFRNKTIVFYDSMGSHNQQCLDALRDYLGAEHADKKKQTYNMDGWSYYSEKGIPQQLNGSDCGMFACKYAEYISRDAPISFTQHDMPYFRRRMVWEILHTTLL